jgi:hypothetical protein
MAKRTQLVEKHGIGANVLNPRFQGYMPNPQYGRFPLEPKMIPKDPNEPKWISTGSHPTRELAERYVAKHFPAGVKVHYFGIRLPKYFFDEPTEALLKRQMARLFNPDAEKRALQFVNGGAQGFSSGV